MDIKNLIPVDGKEGWYRDPLTNAIINNNKSEYEKYMNAYNKRAKTEVTIETLQTEVDEVKSDLKDIKGLLKSLLELQNDSN
ncbi:hypothetical protein [Nonlabens xiamenensis]|uniref:hypothetical protein n=1 Tax=Nonlabens xiamenensis TaxID=2341043 RepID=UPI000F60B31A|nr:hypothetical protein [Nonlabens xiamenensis]|tara:strand:- start:120 stop:365 length:246 start_codon:yes stop_codon:yes gene_type:complete